MLTETEKLPFHARRHWEKACEMYRKTELKNGIRIISERLDHFRSVSLGIWVGTGSRDEKEKQNGISHFIEHMIFKGTQNRSSLRIAKELDMIGGLSNAFTGKEYTCFHSKVLDKHFPALADILSDIFLNSNFDPQEIDRERQVILQELNMLEDAPDEYIHELFHSLFWSNHPLGNPVLGSVETVTAIDRETLLNYLKSTYIPERIIIAVAGSIEHDTVVGFFSPLFETMGQVEIPHHVNSPEIHADISCMYKDLEQVHLCLGGKAPHLSSEMRFAGAVLNTILGGNMSSRLFQEIREKRGLAYSVYSFLSAFMDTGLLGICLGTEPKWVNQSLRIIHKEIDKIQNGAITESDLNEAIEYLTGGILLGAENSDSRMMRNAKNEYIFGRYISYEELVQELEKVTIEDVIDCAREAFRRENVSLATLGPFTRDDLDMDNLRFAVA